MNRPLFLFVGKSASGKTTIANMLEKDGYKQIASYTTRPPRYEGEKEHTFITEEEYSDLENIVASTLYNGYHYCTTLDQIQDVDIYVIDPAGVKTLIDNYNKINRYIYILYFDASICNRIRRMMERHDSDTQIVGRLLQDEENDWIKYLLDIESINRDKMIIYKVDANQNLEDAYTSVKEFIESVKKLWEEKTNEEH